MFDFIWIWELCAINSAFTTWVWLSTANTVRILSFLCFLMIILWDSGLCNSSHYLRWCCSGHSVSVHFCFNTRCITFSAVLHSCICMWLNYLSMVWIVGKLIDCFTIWLETVVYLLTIELTWQSSARILWVICQIWLKSSLLSF